MNDHHCDLAAEPERGSKAADAGGRLQGWPRPRPARNHSASPGKPAHPAVPTKSFVFFALQNRKKHIDLNLKP
jgi:hypothetical protein